MIADEVCTGIGRGGFLARSEVYENRPDILVLGKGLTNGEQPLSALLLSESVVSRIESSTNHPSVRYLWGETMGGTPAACMAALAVLEHVSNPTFLGKVRKTAASFKTLLVQTVGPLGPVVEVRAPHGAMMFGVKLASKSVADHACALALAKGVRLICEGSCIVLMPALVMQGRVWKRICSVMADSILEAAGALE